MVPLWHEAQVPSTSLWLTFVTGLHATVEWQSLHKLLVLMCVGVLPVAVVPLWQVEQAAVTPVCEKVAGVHAAVPWQLPQSAEVVRCVAGLPVARLPLWHEEQVPVT